MTVTSSNYQRRENDMYETETWAVDALLRALPVLDKNTSIWEPAAGNHAWYVWAPADYSHGMPRLFWEGKGVRKMEVAE